MTYNFKGKQFIITGSTRGIGKQIALDLEKLGARLLLTGTNPKQISRLNKNKINKHIEYTYLDLMNMDSVDLFCKKILQLGEIHGLVNNAGINRLNLISEVTDGDLDDMIKVNLTGPVKIIRASSDAMIRKNYGRILNISSIFGVISKTKRSVYSATKFGLNGLTVGTSNDLARYNILCNSLSPGFVLTDLTKQNLSEKELIKLQNEIPIKRLADVSDISKTAVYLVSDLNQYITGQNIIVDGGFTNK